MRSAVVVSAWRSPIGKFGGMLADFYPHVLGAEVIKKAVECLPDKSIIDEVMYGYVTGKQYNGQGRVTSLKAGLPLEVPAISVDRQCGSSLTTFALASILIEAGYGDCMLTGGADCNSNQPYVFHHPVDRRSVPQFWTTMITDEDHGNTPMGITAENVAAKFGITREECDAFAIRSQQNFKKGEDKGIYSNHIAPIAIPQKKGDPIMMVKDEIPRPDTKIEDLAKLPPAFKKGGVVTAGTSSPTCDGASANVVMDEAKAKAMGLKAMCRFKGYASVGLDPDVMGLGPYYATTKLLKEKGMTLDDVDFIEMNEAFAAQSLGCLRLFDYPMDKFNIYGGAIAHGHPLGATGGLLLAKACSIFQHHKEKQFGVITFCCGGGQGVAVLVENIA